MNQFFRWWMFLCFWFLTCQYRCLCGQGLQGRTLSELGWDSVICDCCQATIGSEASIVWHCPIQNYWQHPKGYDICQSCITKIKKVSQRSTAYVVFWKILSLWIVLFISQEKAPTFWIKITGPNGKDINFKVKPSAKFRTLKMAYLEKKNSLFTKFKMKTVFYVGSTKMIDSKSVAEVCDHRCKSQFFLYSKTVTVK